MSDTPILLGAGALGDAANGQVAPGQQPWEKTLERGFSDAKGAVQALHGAFAVAVRSPDGRRAFAAVDRFAVHTLCYRVEDGQIHLATRADVAAGSGQDLDPQALFNYLHFHCIPAPRTVFRGVFRIPAGHCLWFEDGVLTLEPYWTPTFSEPTGAMSLPDLKAEFLQRTEAAVAARLDGGQAACFLSGGTDSSTVAGMVSKLTGGAAHTYSIGFEAEGYDEMAYARLAAKHFTTSHHEYYVTPDDLVARIPTVASAYDQPFGNSSALPAYYCAKMAKDNGATRILAGDGGDELFGGNSRYAKQRVFGWYQLLPQALRRSMLEPLLENTAIGSLPGLRKARSYVEQAKVPMPDRLQMYNLLHRLGIAEVLEPAFIAQVDVDAPLALQRTVWAQARTTSDLNRMLAFDWRFTLADSDLPKVCGTTALAGIDVAFPFLDDGLLDLANGLPEAYKLRGMKLRWFFKEALRGFLPDEILTKRKQGFGLPFGVWLMRHEPLRQLAFDALGTLSGRGIVRAEFVSQLLSKRLPEHPGYYGEMVWILMMLEHWLRAHAPNARFGG